MGKKKVDWAQVAVDYITGTASYADLAEKYGVSVRSIERHSSDGEWIKKRRDFCDKMTVRKEAAEGRKRVKREGRYRDIEDKLLDTLEKAVGELDLTIKTKTKKTKIIKYENQKRPDKPTKEIIDEAQEVELIHVIVDCSKLAAVTTVLEKLENMRGIKTKLDRDEQKARIKALQARGNENDGGENEISVEFAGNMGEFAG